MAAASPAVKLAIGEQISGNTSVVEVIEGISDHSIDFERCYEFDNSHTSVHSVKGRLKDHFNFWSHDLGASDFILQVISNGYAIPFVTIPPKAFFRNNNSVFIQVVLLRFPIPSRG